VGAKTRSQRKTYVGQNSVAARHVCGNARWGLGEYKQQGFDDETVYELEEDKGRERLRGWVEEKDGPLWVGGSLRFAQNQSRQPQGKTPLCRPQPQAPIGRGRAPHR
jgi:hypothetical protein